MQTQIIISSDDIIGGEIVKKLLADHGTKILYSGTGNTVRQNSAIGNLALHGEENARVQFMDLLDSQHILNTGDAEKIKKIWFCCEASLPGAADGLLAFVRSREVRNSISVNVILKEGTRYLVSRLPEICDAVEHGSPVPAAPGSFEDELAAALSNIKKECAGLNVFVSPLLVYEEPEDAALSKSKLYEIISGAFSYFELVKNRVNNYHRIHAQKFFLNKERHALIATVHDFMRAVFDIECRSSCGYYLVASAMNLDVAELVSGIEEVEGIRVEFHPSTEKFNKFDHLLFRKTSCLYDYLSETAAEVRSTGLLQAIILQNEIKKPALSLKKSWTFLKTQKARYEDLCDNILGLLTKKEITCRYGDSLEYHVYDSQKSETIILLNAVGVQYSVFKWLIPRFIRKYNVITWDSRGVRNGREHGEETVFNAVERAEDILEVVRAENAGAIHIFGWCSGSLDAIIFAALHPELVKTLYLVGGVYNLDTIMQSKYNKNLETICQIVDTSPALIKGALSRFLNFDLPTISEDDNPDVLYNMIMERPDKRHKSIVMEVMSNENLLREFSKLYIAGGIKHDISPLMGKIKAPTAVIHGEDDHLVYPQQSEWLCSQLPHARLFKIEGATHWLPCENPAEVASVIERFQERMNRNRQN